MLRLLTLGATLLTITSVFAQSVQNALPLEQTQGDVTLRVLKAGFLDDKDAYEGLNAGTSWGAPQSGRRGFSVRYQVQSAKPKKELDSVVSKPNGSAGYYNDWRARAEATTVHLYAPSGELLKPCAGAAETSPRQQQYLKWVSVSPHWDRVGLEVIALDPAAPMEATGHFSQVLVFKDVPIPHKVDQKLAVDSFLQTRHGTTVTLDNAQLEDFAHGDDKYALVFNFQWEPPPGLDDVKFDYDLESVRDPQGKPLESDGGGGGSDGNHDFNIRVDLKQKPQAPSVTLAVRISEKADAWRQSKWFRRFRCDLKLPAAIEPVTESGPPLQVVEAQGVRGALELPKSLGEEDRRHAWLWMLGSDKSVALDGVARGWFIKSLQARAANGVPVSATCIEDIQHEENQMAWRRDGSPAAPGEHAQSIYIDWAKVRPTKASLEVTAEEKRHRHRVGDFPEVPLPAAGQARDVNLIASPELPIVLRRIFRIGDPKAMPELLGWDRKNIRPGTVAAVFEVTPDLPDTQMVFRGRLAEDDTGRLLDINGAIDVVAGNTLRPVTTGLKAGKNQLRTLLIRPPAPDAKSLHLQVVIDEMKPTGRQATLLFPDVTLP